VSPGPSVDRPSRGAVRRRFLAAGAASLAGLALACRPGAARAGVAQHPAPWASILSCADSRVAPERHFGDTARGELFVARSAGHQTDTNTLGTLEYGAKVLGLPLIVVLGHERGGAVAAACDRNAKGRRDPGSIGPMIQAIAPAAQPVARQPEDYVDNAVRENARQNAARIAQRSTLIADLVKQGKVRIVAARYDLDDRKVECFA
jgi:carbonic anhydrase